MILIILFLTLVYSYTKRKFNLMILLLFMIGFVISRSKGFNLIEPFNLIESFNTDNLRFIPCSDDDDNHMYHNYQLQYVDTDTNKRNNILHTLYSDNINKMFQMPNCNIDDDYKFSKSYTGFFDRKIFSLDSIEQKLNDNHNMIKDSLLYNDPFIYRHPQDLETKIISDYDNEFKKDFENYLDYNIYSSPSHSICNTGVINFTTVNNGNFHDTAQFRISNIQELEDAGFILVLPASQYIIESGGEQLISVSVYSSEVVNVEKNYSLVLYDLNFLANYLIILD